MAASCLGAQVMKFYAVVVCFFSSLLLGALDFKKEKFRVNLKSLMGSQSIGALEGGKRDKERGESNRSTGVNQGTSYLVTWRKQPVMCLCCQIRHSVVFLMCCDHV